MFGEFVHAHQFHAKPTQTATTYPLKFLKNQKVDGEWTEVRKTDRSLFAEDRAVPLYIPTRIDGDGQLPMIYEGANRYWWCRVTAPHEYSRWKLMSTWLPRIARVLDKCIASLPAIISIEVAFNGFELPHNNRESELSREAIEADVRVKVDQVSMSLAIEAGVFFEEGLARSENIAEAALVASIVRGCIDLAGNDAGVAREPLVQAIVQNEQARDTHAFQARRFRDFIGDQLRDAPVGIDSIDTAKLRLGLGWSARSPDNGGEIEGRSECNAFLNAVVSQLEEELCIELRRFNRRSLVEFALRNHELAMARQATWRRTASAILGLHSDHESTMATIAEQEFENNGVLQASRVLAELAVCECPISDGLDPGEMDLSHLMARLMLLTQFGDWSDAIYHHGMEPSILVTTLGDVHVSTAFIEKVVMPFGNLANESMVDVAVDGYARNFTAPSVIEDTTSSFDEAFVDAWRDEKQATLDSFRQFVDAVEDFGIKRKSPVLIMPRSELLGLYNSNDSATEAIVASLSTAPRAGWRTLPDGMLDKDRWPWRYRRRLSLLRRPIIQIDEGADPLVVVSPGLLRDAVVYTVDNYHEGYFPPWQIKTKRMRAWAGTAADRRGNRFSRQVAERLGDLGWQVESEVKVSKILGHSLDRDYGDVDVLAWNSASKRVLLIECKDLHFHKTAGELAEQLSDFRGEIRDGKRDLLRKHLDRIHILQSELPRVAKYLNLSLPLVAEGWIVFCNPVPMLFVTEHFGEVVHATTFAKLADL